MTVFADNYKTYDFNHKLKFLKTSIPYHELTDRFSRTYTFQHGKALLMSVDSNECGGGG